MAKDVKLILCGIALTLFGQILQSSLAYVIAGLGVFFAIIGFLWDPGKDEFRSKTDKNIDINDDNQEEKP